MKPPDPDGRTDQIFAGHFRDRAADTTSRPTGGKAMTPQERQRVDGLFDRLAQLENTQRDREAEAAIADGLQQAPHAAYALVQTVLIQEEALERASARIRELEAQSDATATPQSSGGFLDSLRGAFGGNAGTPQRVSVPVTRRPGDPMGVPAGFQQNAARGAQQEQQIGRGGSFLGQAASIAAGVVVGSLAVDALRGHFGGDKAQAAESGVREQPAGNEAAQQESAGHDYFETTDAGDGDFGGDFGGGDFGGGE
jgi:hypothetical protein